ncbi:hypothetical protein BCR42DRAFT_470517 [Absidia repens]|uniref:Zn(2)-C6 fungal-type domain-containing protein n=1 Tax=Absidia repens TaxID=90262 RepID=A0A1X2I494_9FUNG|nr:hypothetical protein BCR42DRAFT_470517 [Absidia repens]
MMTSLDETRQKRNKPCENCRAHRRRCIPTESTQCERCIKKRLNCVYKVTLKPILAKNMVPASKRIRVLDQVRDIKDTLDDLEQEMQLILSSSNRHQRQDQTYVTSNTTKNNQHAESPDSTFTIQRDRNTKQPSWTVTIQPSGNGIQLETSINSMVDLVQFLTQGFGYVSNPPQRPPNYYSNNAQQTMMVVTNKMLQVEQTLRQVFGKSSSSTNEEQQQQQNTSGIITTSITEPEAIYSNSFIRQATVLHLVDSHFHCVRSMTPIVSSYYLPLICKYPDSTVAYALAGFMALSSCVVHVNDKLIPYNRSDFGQYLYHSAREKLRDDLFGDDDDHAASLETVMALFAMTQSSMILLRNNDTQIYLDLAWRMILTLRNEHLPVLRNYPPSLSPQRANVDFITTPKLARAETWRRLFYSVRFLVIHVQIIQDNSIDFSMLLSQSDIGYPLPLPCEMDDPERKRIVETFSYYVLMDDCHISSHVDTIGYQLFAGVLDEASLSEISFMEHRLFSYWQGVSKEFHLMSTPMEYLDPSVVQQCQDVHILRLNQLYYSHWLSLEIRFMQSPSDADLKDTTLERMDGGRALLIVSICGDALAHLFQALYHRETCTLDLHWLLITTDALQLLTKTANSSVRKRAERNLQMCLPVMMAQMKAKHDAPSSSSSSTSLLTMPPQPPALASTAETSPSYSYRHQQQQQQQQQHPTGASSPSYSTSSSLPSISSPDRPDGYQSYHHANSPGNVSTSTSSEGLEYEIEDDWTAYRPSPSITVSSDMDPSLAYYGEVKKNLESYFMDGPIEELD